jgi:hypothetical protein
MNNLDLLKEYENTISTSRINLQKLRSQADSDKSNFFFLVNEHEDFILNLSCTITELVVEARNLFFSQVKNYIQKDTVTISNGDQIIDPIVCLSLYDHCKTIINGAAVINLLVADQDCTGTVYILESTKLEITKKNKNLKLVILSYSEMLEKCFNIFYPS